MIRTLFDQIALFDTSAVIALHDPGEPRHSDVREAFTRLNDVQWAVLDLTSHECFTRVRNLQGWRSAMEHYDFLRGGNLRLIRFHESDESEAIQLLTRFQDHSISFHDALCAAAMLRSGIFRILTLDADFTILGFESIPAA